MAKKKPQVRETESGSATVGVSVPVDDLREIDGYIEEMRADEGLTIGRGPALLALARAGMRARKSYKVTP